MSTQAQNTSKEITDYIEVFYSEKHQSFYIKKSANSKIPKHATPFWVGSEARFTIFQEQYILPILIKPKPFVPYQLLVTLLREFIGNSVKAEELLVEFYEIINKK